MESRSEGVSLFVEREDGEEGDLLLMVEIAVESESISFSSRE